MMNKDELRSFAATAQREIDNGSVEDKLRHLLSASLSKIFPDSPWWVQEHVMGTETYSVFWGTKYQALLFQPHPQLMVLLPISQR